MRNHTKHKPVLNHVVLLIEALLARAAEMTLDVRVLALHVNLMHRHRRTGATANLQNKEQGLTCTCIIFQCAVKLSSAL